MTDILLVRLSSMGDLIHTYPALTDLGRHFPDARVTWVCEEGFAELPPLHPLVKTTLPMAWRRWRKRLWQPAVWREMREFHARLTFPRFDVVLDAQGLIKSAGVAHLARGLKGGFDRRSAREGLAALAYDKTYAVPRGQHAVVRNRQLFAQVFGYTPEGPVDFGLSPQAPLPDWAPTGDYAVLLHATSKAEKEWDEARWVALGQALQARGLALILPWGAAHEQARSQRLAQHLPGAIVPPARLSLHAAASLLKQARLTIGVDTGLTHLANAVDCPLVALYTHTDPGLTGVTPGPRACNLGGVGATIEVTQVLEAAQAWL